MRKPTWSTSTTAMRLKRTPSSPTSDCRPPIRILQWVYKASHCSLSRLIPTLQPEVELIRLTPSIQCSMLTHLDSLRACISQHPSASTKDRVEDSPPVVNIVALRWRSLPVVYHFSEIPQPAFSLTVSIKAAYLSRASEEFVAPWAWALPT